MIDAAAAVAAINQHHGTRYRLAGPMPAGESGAAHLIADELGVEYVLKWGEGPEFRVHRTVTIVRRLRTVGYPAPEIVVTSDEDETLGYLVQRVMPGKRPTVLSGSLLDRIVKLNGLQEDAAAEFEESWPASIAESIERGYSDWCVHKSLMSYSSETVDILDELKRTTAGLSDTAFRQHDAVHFDFIPRTCSLMATR